MIVTHLLFGKSLLTILLFSSFILSARIHPMVQTKELHEKYHKNTSIQEKIIMSNNFTYRNIIFFLNRYLFNSNKNKKILDIGCGAGAIPLYIADRGYDVLGIDISEKAVKSAVASAKILGLLNAKFRLVDFPKEGVREKFDFIIFTETVEHIPDDILALRKIYNLLNKNGIVILSTPSIDAPLYRLGLTKKFDREVGHIRRYKMKELIKECQKVGFRVIETRKTEGIIRNFLFVNPVAGKSIRFIKFFLSDFVAFVDNISLKLFGESNFFLILKKS